MNQHQYRKALLWGVGLWLIGYVLGILLFALVPASMIGWVITPIGIVITLWVIFKKLNVDSLKFNLKLGTIWAVIAILFDYLFIVKLFKPLDGYYKADVYLYYILTFALPMLAWWWRQNTAKSKK